MTRLHHVNVEIPATQLRLFWTLQVKDQSAAANVVNSRSMSSSSADVFSSTRPMTGLGPQTPQALRMQAYAYGSELQGLLQAMITDLIAEQPKDPLTFSIDWLVVRRDSQGLRLTRPRAPSLAGKLLSCRPTFQPCILPHACRACAQ